MQEKPALNRAAFRQEYHFLGVLTGIDSPPAVVVFTPVKAAGYAGGDS